METLDPDDRFTADRGLRARTIVAPDALRVEAEDVLDPGESRGELRPGVAGAEKHGDGVLQQSNQLPQPAERKCTAG